jgi:septal ring factor EnvC (AmiA/AmiB activator)
MRIQMRSHERWAALRRVVAASVLLAALDALAIQSAQAQDVRGLEVCTAEKQMDRRTGCLQSNVEFLQGVIEKNARDARQKLDAAARELAAARTEINTLKATLAAAQTRLDKLEKAAADRAKAK